MIETHLRCHMPVLINGYIIMPIVVYNVLYEH